MPGEITEMRTATSDISLKIEQENKATYGSFRYTARFSRRNLLYSVDVW